MNDNNITVKDLANKYGVSEQAIRAFCKAHNIRKEIVQLKQGKRETYCFDENALKLIQNHYSSESRATQASATNKSNESNTTQLLIDSLQEQITILQGQITQKDNEINNLLSQIEALQGQITEQNAERRAERQERQTLLARLLQIEQKPEIDTTTAPAPAEQNPAQTAQDNAQSKPRTTQRREPTARKTPKKGIFTTLFNRKGR